MSRSILLLLLIFASSCTSTKTNLQCGPESVLKSSLINKGISPIELLYEEKIIRIWIDRSSSVNELITIFRDSSENYAEYLEIGYFFKRDNPKAHFSKTEICPSQGWEKFFGQLDSLKLNELKTRKNDPSSDGIIMGHPRSRYLIEIKEFDSIKRFEFYSFYPSPEFPEDMTTYKALEKLLLSSFAPLAEKLKYDQKRHQNLGPFEY